LSRDYCPPGHDNPAMGFFLGVDQDSIVGAKNNLFFCAFPPQKTVKSSSDGRARHRNRSGVVELVGREPWIIARVENGVTKFSPQRQKTPKFSKKIGSGKQFSAWGIFIFWPREN